MNNYESKIVVQFPMTGTRAFWVAYCGGLGVSAAAGSVVLVARLLAWAAG